MDKMNRGSYKSCLPVIRKRISSVKHDSSGFQFLHSFKIQLPVHIRLPVPVK